MKNTMLSVLGKTNVQYLCLLAFNNINIVPQSCFFFWVKSYRFYSCMKSKCFRKDANDLENYTKWCRLVMATLERIKVLCIPLVLPIDLSNDGVAVAGTLSIILQKRFTWWRLLMHANCSFNSHYCSNMNSTVSINRLHHTPRNQIFDLKLHTLKSALVCGGLPFLNLTEKSCLQNTRLQTIERIVSIANERR